jgi:xylulokinase
LSTLLVGRFAPLDVSDASGMNLLELWTGQWSDDMLEATAPDLRHKLGSVVPSFQALGPVSPYLASRFGLPRDCVVVPATGDNPSSIVGMGLGEVGDVMVSLGTSDTLIGLTTSPHPCEEGHVMASPRQEGEWFAMLCYKVRRQNR